MFSRALTVFVAIFLVSAVNAGSNIQPVQTEVAPQAQTLDTASKIDAHQPIGDKEGVAKPPVSQPQAPKVEAVRPQTAQIEAMREDTVHADSHKLVATQPESAPPKVDKPAEGNPSVSQMDKVPASPPTVPQVAPPIVELLPHRATYSVALDKNHFDDKSIADEDIENAKGQMTIQMAKAGDGWAIEQKLTLHIYYKDGTAEQVITSLATYESLDGLKYNFNARTLRGDVEEVISGDAILASKGGAGIVTYQQPDESTVQLPVGTLFPTQHLIYVLEAAMKGQKVVSNIVFDGSSETHEPVQVNTILGASQEPKLALTNKDLLQFKRVWPMRMAVYAVDSPAAEPDYEINQNVLDRGVIRDMTLDYGTFKIKAVLVEVVVFS